MVNTLELAKYILKHSNKELSNLELQKTLYFTELDYIKKFDKHLVSDDFEAWKYGPVAREVYYKYRNYGANPIDKPKEETLLQNLRKDELENINHSIEKCNEKSYWDLVKESHKENGAWHKSFKEDRKEIISKNLIRQEAKQTNGK
ncbi:Panacea domain-containing protein [Helicobacter pylori]